MAKKTTRKRALPKSAAKATMHGATNGVAAPTNTGSLEARLNADRLARRMTWPDYAAFLGVKLSTVYKIAQGRTTRPHALTVVQIEERLAIPVGPNTAEGADDAVVSGGQRHPERPEN